jgi:hypothetical protein
MWHMFRLLLQLLPLSGLKFAVHFCAWLICCGCYFSQAATKSIYFTWL